MRQNKRVVQLVSMLILAWLFSTLAYAAAPLWTYSSAIPSGTVAVSSKDVATVTYTVQNQSNHAKDLMLKPTMGLTASDCHLNGKGSTCSLKLTVHGDKIPTMGLHYGPILCEKGNPNQCYQPESKNQLNIVKARDILLSISGTPLVLTVTEGGGSMIVTNTSDVATAYNVAADFTDTPLAGHVNQDSSQCQILPPKKSCTLVFTPNMTQMPQTSFPIRGTNTQVAVGAISVVLPSSAPIRITNSPLTLEIGSVSSGVLTVLNESSVLTAHNVIGDLSAALDANLIQDASACTSIAPGGTCNLSFTLRVGAVDVAATTVPVQGDNTSTATARIAINGPTLVPIAITQGRNMTLNTNDTHSFGLMQITNNGASTATNVSAFFSDTALNGRIQQDDSNCQSLSPGATCTLKFTVLGTTNVPSTTFGVAGSNTTHVTGTLTISTITSGASIGTPLAGGVIASPYVTPGGENACGTMSSTLYLVAATNDFTPGIVWGGQGTATDANSATNGYQNTQTIVNILGSSGAYAALTCFDYTLDDTGHTPCEYGVCYQGWYLPARTEMNCLYINQLAIGNFSTDNYWASTEDGGLLKELYALIFRFPNLSSANETKNTLGLVRCVRAINAAH